MFRRGWARRNFAKMFDTRKTRMIGLPCGEETMAMLSHFHGIPERNEQTDGQA